MEMAVLQLLKLALFAIFFIYIRTVLSQSAACGPLCSVCETDLNGDVIRAVCTNTDIPSLPDTVQEMYLSQGQLSLNILKDFYFIGKTDLRIVHLTNYQIDMVWNSPFVNCSDLISLDLSHNSLSSFDNSNLQGPSGLQYLNLSYNQLNTLPNNSFSSQTSLQELNLSYNHITAILHNSLANLGQLTSLDISGNNIATIKPESLHDLSNLQTANFENNKLNKIVNDLFKDKTQLKYVLLQNNVISEIGMTSFLNVHNIEVFDMSGNKMSGIPTFTLQEISNSRLSVDLSDNNIIKIQNQAFVNVTMQKMDLRSNSLAMIDMEAFQDCSVQEMDLSDNQLTTLPGSMADYLKSPIKPTVNLTNNPWDCNCALLWLAEYLNDPQFPGEQQMVVCNTPQSLQGIEVKHLANHINKTECELTYTSTTMYLPTQSQTTIVTTETTMTPTSTSLATTSMTDSRNPLTNSSYFTSVAQLPRQSQSEVIQDGGSNTGVILGVSAGLLAAAVTAAVLFIVFRRFRRKQKVKQDESQNFWGDSEAPSRDLGPSKLIFKPKG